MKNHFMVNYNKNNLLNMKQSSAFSLCQKASLWERLKPYNLSKILLKQFRAGSRAKFVDCFVFYLANALTGKPEFITDVLK